MLIRLLNNRQFLTELSVLPPTMANLKVPVEPAEYYSENPTSELKNKYSDSHYLLSKSLLFSIMQGTLCCTTPLCIIILHFGSLGQDCNTIKWWMQLFTCDHRAGSNLRKPSLKPSTIVISSSLVTLQFLQSARSGILNKPASTCKIFIRKSSTERRMSDPIISCRYNLFTKDFKALVTQRNEVLWELGKCGEHYTELYFTHSPVCTIYSVIFPVQVE